MKKTNAIQNGIHPIYKFDQRCLSETGFLRLSQIIGDPKANPKIQPLIPIGRTTFLNRVKQGIYPQPVRLGQRIVAWRVEDIKALIEEIGES